MNDNCIFVYLLVGYRNGIEYDVFRLCQSIMAFGIEILKEIKKTNKSLI